MVASENRTQPSSTTESVSTQYTRTATPRAAAEPAEAGRRVAREPLFVREPFWFLSLIVAGATMAAMWGVGAAVLAILGLCAVTPQYMLPVAGLVLGVGFFKLGTMDIAWERMFRFTDRQAAGAWRAYYGGTVAVLAAGVVAIVLGIVNLVFLADVRLAAVAVIAMGVGLFLHSGIVYSVSLLTHEAAYSSEAGVRPAGPFAFNALSVAPVRDAIVGIGGVVLGILALMHIAPIILGFAALLAMAMGLTFTASTICGATLATLNDSCPRSGSSSAAVL